MTRIQYRLTWTEKFTFPEGTKAVPFSGRVTEIFSEVEDERRIRHDACVNFYGGADGNEVIMTSYRYRPVTIEARAYSDDPWPRTWD